MFGTDLVLWSVFVACAIVVAIASIVQIVLATVRRQYVPREPLVVLALFVAVFLLRGTGLLNDLSAGVVGLLLTAGAIIAGIVLRLRTPRE